MTENSMSIHPKNCTVTKQYMKKYKLINIDKIHKKVKTKKVKTIKTYIFIEYRILNIEYRTQKSILKSNKIYK